MKSLKSRLGIGIAVVIFAVTGFNLANLSETAPPDLRLVLNIPARRLDVYEHGTLTRRYAISAGRRE